MAWQRHALKCVTYSLLELRFWQRCERYTFPLIRFLSRQLSSLSQTSINFNDTQIIDTNTTRPTPKWRQLKVTQRLSLPEVTLVSLPSILTGIDSFNHTQQRPRNTYKKGEVSTPLTLFLVSTSDCIPWCCYACWTTREEERRSERWDEMRREKCFDFGQNGRIKCLFDQGFQGEMDRKDEDAKRLTAREEAKAVRFIIFRSIDCRSKTDHDSLSEDKSVKDFSAVLQSIVMPLQWECTSLLDTHIRLSLRSMSRLVETLALELQLWLHPFKSKMKKRCFFLRKTHWQKRGKWRIYEERVRDTLTKL